MGAALVDRFVQDVRYGLRKLRGNLGFTCAVVLVMGLGIGVTTTVYSVVNAVLLRPLTYRDAERIARVHEVRTGRRVTTDMSGHTLEAWRESRQTIDFVAGHNPRTFALTGTGDPVRVRGALVSSTLFPILGVSASKGRTFTLAEEEPGQDLVAVLSHAAWRDRFGGDPDVIGRTIMLDETPRSVVGVMPDGFTFPYSGTEVWVPLVLTVPGDASATAVFSGIAKLKEGVGLEQAQIEGQTVVSRLWEQSERQRPGPSGTAPTLRLTPLQEDVVGGVRVPLLALFGAVCFVLLIAVANLANLCLVRGVGRRRELAIRAAVGAWRSRLVCQLLTESVALGAVGGAFGILTAYGLIGLLPYLPLEIPRLGEVTLDRTVFTMAIAITLGASLLFGLVPAFQVSRFQLVQGLQERSPSAGGIGSGGAVRTRGVLVVIEVALALVLLVSAGLMLRSLVALMSVETGHDPNNVLTARLHLPSARYGEQTARTLFYDELMRRVAQRPSVGAVGFGMFLPVSPVNRIDIEIPGQPQPSPGAPRTSSGLNVVSDGYLEAMGLRLVHGRFFDERDTATSPNTVVVNESFIGEYGLDLGAVGRQIATHRGQVSWRIAGVVGDVRHHGLESDMQPMVYVSHRQEGEFGFFGTVPIYLTVRTDGDPLEVIPLLRRDVSDLDAALPLGDVMTMNDRLSASVAQPQFFSFMLGAFGATAVLLAMVGIYGVVAYSASQRKREIVLRMALGAHRSSVLYLVARQGLWLVGLGGACGLAGAWGATRALDSLLFEISPLDPPTIALALVVLITAALVACCVPGWRATRADLATGLRSESLQ